MPGGAGAQVARRRQAVANAAAGECAPRSSSPPRQLARHEGDQARGRPPSLLMRGQASIAVGGDDRHLDSRRRRTSPSPAATLLATIRSQPLRSSLCARVVDQRSRLGGEADDERRPVAAARRDLGENVGVLGEREDRRAVAALLELLLRRRLRPASRRPPPRRRRRRPAAPRSSRRSISRAVSTRTTVTPGGSASAVGPLTRMTSAPAARAAAAIAWPCRPEERLPMKRTGSIGSWVGPEVTTTRRPASAPPRGSADAGRQRNGGRRLQRAFDRRDDRQRLGHAAGPIFAAGHLARRPARRTARRRRAGSRRCAGSRDAATCARSSPARPARACRSPAASSSRDRRRGRCAMWARRSAVAGATTMRSASRENSMWPMPDCSSGRTGPAHRLAAQRLGRQRRDELLGRGGHRDAHRRAAFAQAANQVERLVGRDAAADDQQDAGARECLCGHASGLRAARRRTVRLVHGAAPFNIGRGSTVRAMAKLRPAAPCR